MPDPRYFTTLDPLTADEIAAITNGVLFSGEGGAIARWAAPIDSDDLSGALVYCCSGDALSNLTNQHFGACFTTPALARSAPSGGAIIAVKSPRLAFALAASRLHESLKTNDRLSASDIPSSAVIDKTAVITVGAKISREVKIGAHVYIGPGVSIGEGAVLEAGVCVTHAVIGRNVCILAGARIGQAGFGFVEGDNGLVRVPQLGSVIIGDDVEIGANATIDRGALADTVIGRGTKIDNLVQIGHNVRIGQHCILAAQTGISGSCVIGDGVMIGGQVGLTDHLHIGDGALIAAGSGLMRDVPAGEKWGGSPARPVKDWLKEIATLSRLARKKNG